jgi:CheY-like chemotaxis protein
MKMKLIHSDFMQIRFFSTDQDTGRETHVHSQPEVIFTRTSIARSAAQTQTKTIHPIRGRILVADDDALVRASLAAVLESEGYIVDEARNGREAVIRAIARRPDLVLLDLNMPHWDGWTTFNQLDQAAPLLPVIVITARPNQYEKAVQLGVDAFMEKPLKLGVLLRAIQRLMLEDSDRHLRRITNRSFVTRLLDEPEG